MFDFIRNWALNLNGFDGISHYWRVALALNSDTWTTLIDTLLKGPGALNLGLDSPTQTGTTANKSTQSESTSDDDAEEAPSGAVGNLLKPLNGLTKGLTGGSLLQKKKSADGGSTGLDKKQESSLLGFLLGGGK
jgi:phospholipid/cholesterol/gamma-HCH transport system substrate-binding protein